MGSVGMPQWVAHAGLGIALPGGSPTVQTLGDALRLRVDRVELDVCATADGALLLRHDARTDAGLPVERLSLAELRRAEPWLLTLDEALDHLGRMPLLLDVKTLAAAPPLGRWLRRRRDASRFAVCTEVLPALVALRQSAPRVERWRSFPDVGSRRTEYVARVAAALARHLRPAHAGYLARELSAAVLDFGAARHDHGRHRAGGAPWRRLLPPNLDRLAAEAGAAAISVHHFLVSPQLAERAARLRLPVVAWTVNNSLALERVLACGVAMVTTDDPRGMRAVAAGLTP
ncbi:MAG TPA: glycerophosphodiester phosphodiesterase [Candidatus Angelobacter sp.]|jgi:glycerophosphoryl diester phosphodiesterase|nr:glycerophosphodiester phosphodiesterase [Candidatus Angelobacter sp.]